MYRIMSILGVKPEIASGGGGSSNEDKVFHGNGGVFWYFML